MKNFFFALCLLVLFSSLGWAGGAIYKWTDAHGVQHIGSKPPSGVEVELVTAQGGGVEKVSESKVDLYVTDWCPYCRKAASYLKEKGIKFKEYNIERDASAARRMQEMTSNRGVPFALICGHKITGFHPPTYDKALTACQ